MVAVSLATPEGGTLWDPLPVTLPSYVECAGRQAHVPHDRARRAGHLDLRALRSRQRDGYGYGYG